MTKLTLLIITTIFVYNGYTQKIKSKVVQYQYVQLPLTPINKNIRNYNSIIVADYISTNRKKQAEYNSELERANFEFETANAAYPALVAEAELEYERELSAYNQKSLAIKVLEKKVLDEDNKPVKRIPPSPVMRNVREPILQKEYDLPALAKTYLTVDGFKNDLSNAVKINVIIYGFDHTKPRNISEVKKQVSSSNGTTTTKNITYYHTEFSYRHTMSVRVNTPDGKEILFLTPQELNNYKKYKSNESTVRQSINNELLISNYEEKVLQDNLLFIQNLVNDRIGYKHQDRSISLYYVKEKKGVYTDLLVAFNNLHAGLKLLIDDELAAEEKLEKSIAIYEEALVESNLNDKKARINKNISYAVFFNVLECYFATGKLDKAESILTNLNSLPLSGVQRKLKEEYETLINETRKRIKANNY